MAPPLKGIKVLDLSRILAGPWATMTLGDLGAEVWKVEHPQGGDDTRKWAPPAVNGVATYFLAANRNKKSIAVDLAKDEGRRIVRELAKRADVMVENFRAESLRKLKLDYASLKKLNPRLIGCSISGYGRTGPLSERAGYDFVMQAECGFMAITGETKGAPMKLGVAFIDLVTGGNAVQAILAALYARERTGKGQHIDLALSDSALHFLANIGSGHLNTGRDAQRFGNAHPSIVPYQLLDCGDGAVALAIGNDEQYRRLCANVLNAPGLWADDRFKTNAGRVEHREELLPLLEKAAAKLGVRKVMAGLERHNLPAGAVKTVAEAFASDFARGRDVVVTSPHPTIGTVKTVRSPLRLSSTKTVAPTAPPLLGQHSRAVLKNVLGYSARDIRALEKNGVIASAKTR